MRIAMSELRAALGGLVVGLVGCSPAIPLSVALPACVPADAEVALLVEEGPCGDRAGAIAWWGDLATAPSEPFAPGSYCVDALAFSTGTERGGHRCRVEALGRENRRLPVDRAEIALMPTCASEPSLLGDDLLAEVAGCNGACDVERCICSLGCAIDAPGADCPLPIAVDRVVMGDHYACGLGSDRRSFTCWGDGEEVSAIFGWAPTEPGVATPGVGATALPYVRYDGDAETFCHRTSDAELRCGADVLETLGMNEPRLMAVGRGFSCWGEGTLRCYAPGGSVPLPEFSFPSAISAGHDQLCGIVDGFIRCATPFVDEGACGAGCPWFEGATIVPPPTLGARTVYWAELDLGWDRACAIDSRARLSCWSVDPLDPIGLGPPAPSSQVVDGLSDLREPRLVELGARRTQEVSVGAEHLCLRDLDGVVSCGRLAEEGPDLVLVDEEPFPGEGNIVSFTAGPAGISCAVRSVEGAPNRVECFQLAGSSGRQGLLGRAHTRAGLDERAVCP